jgi:signal transduction histidine kinase
MFAKNHTLRSIRVKVFGRFIKFLLFVIAPFFLFQEVIFGRWLNFSIIFVSTLLCFFSYVIINKGRHRIASGIIIVVLYLTMTLFGILNYWEFIPDYIWFIPITVISYVMLGKKWGNITAVICTITFIAIRYAFYAQQDVFNTSEMFEHSMIFVTSLAVTVFFTSNILSAYESSLDVLQENQKKVDTQEKLVQMGIVSSGIAHELKNPVNIIDGSSKVMMDMLDKKSKFDVNMMKSLIANSLSQTQRMTEIINNVLGQVRGNSGVERKVKHDIAEVLRESLKLSISAFKNNYPINIKTNLDVPFIAIINGRPLSLQRAIINVVDNSLYEMYQKQQQQSSYLPQIGISLKQQDESVVIIISDNGPGMDQEQIQKAFYPFYSNKDPGNGTGLGLSMVNDIVSEHNGEVNIESDNANYTNVTITLPINDKEAASS